MREERKQMFGFHNVVARVDATQRSYALKVICDDILRKTLGGKGLATHLLLSYNAPNCDALDPESHLVLAIGPASGTNIPGSGCHGVFAKSPQTGYCAESYAGDHVAECIAGTGFDAVILHGASQTPVWLEASEETIAFHSAEHLWGLGRQETENHITEWMREHRPAARKCGVVVIGPEAENPVAASIMNKDSWRSAGGAGIGAVMGSKKVKAVVFWGNRQKELANPQVIDHIAKDLAQRATNHANAAAGRLAHAPMWGTGVGLKIVPSELAGMTGLNRIQGKAEVFAELEDRLTILDSLILCRSHLDLYQWEELAAIIKGITGLELTKESMRSIAGGITDGSRRFNLWQGVTAEEDGFPGLFWAETFSEMGGTVGEEQMKQLLTDYYGARGWDEKGKPPDGRARN
jgi:aldehyde:ferredoxin oxidoreductase